MNHVDGVRLFQKGNFWEQTKFFCRPMLGLKGIGTSYNKIVNHKNSKLQRKCAEF